MVKENAKLYMEKLNFPINDQKELLQVLDDLLKTDDFLGIVKRYEKDSFDFFSMIEDAKILAESKQICIYTAHMLLFICMLPNLRKKYFERSIDEKIFLNTILDLRYKLEECRLVHGKCGTFVPMWYKGLFNMKIFALGRLQFEINTTWFDCEIDGKNIPKNTKVLSVHIPRTGTSLDHSLVHESYNLAKEFFKEEFLQEIIFICNSWLLYPWNRTVYKADSNLAKFYDDFTIVSSGEYTNYSESWRLFDCEYKGDTNLLPNNTSLRRSYIERIKNNEPIGYGTGVIIM